MKLWVLCTLWIITSLAAADTETCMTDLDIGSFTFAASSETQHNPASAVFTNGWCASNTTNDQHIDIQFKTAMGFKALTVGPKDEPSSSYPKSVRVQYIPIGSTTLQEFPVPGGLVIKVDAPTHATSKFEQGLAVLKLRLVLQDFEKEPCMKIALKGCTIQDLCPVCVHGTCIAENHCQCQPGYLEDGCDREDCTPVTLGLGDGSLPGNQITVSSELSPYTKEEIRNAEGRMGWCPADSDKHPWASISLGKPMAVKMLQFDYVLKTPTYTEKMYMSEFELLYIAPQDSSRLLRSFHTDIPSLNGTHYFTVTLVPAVITDTIFIRATKYHIRSCFKLELYGCDPKGMCSQNWCQNGGSCVGENACACANGFFGERCELKKTDIPTVNTTFLSITNNVLITTSLHFTVTGQVTLDITSQIPVLFLTGLGSFVQLKETSTTIACLKDINKCTAGFTFALDVKFDKLLDNTYILSSGGNLQNTHGIALYYTKNTLVYIVTTTNFRWTLQVPYTPVLNVWQHFEITWNKNIGMELHLNGHLLGTVGRPDPVSTSQTANLCIGCSHTTLQVEISMHIKEFHVWTIDRTELVNAGLKPTPAPVTTSAPGASTHTSLMMSTSSTSPSTTTTTTTTIPTTTVKRDPLNPYDLIFIKQQGNILHTRENSLTFLSHGNPVLYELVPSIWYTLTLNSLTGDYLELRNKGVTCIDNFDSCKEGFTVLIKVSIISSSQSSKIYIVSNEGENGEKSGIYFYHQGSNITLGFRHETHLWETSKQYTFIPGVLYTCLFSWSETDGLLLYINNHLIGSVPVPVTVPLSSSPGVFLIGKTIGKASTTIMYDLKIWVTSFKTLLYHTVFTTLPTTTRSTTTVIATRSSTTDSLHSLVTSSSYNLTFTSIQNNILYTPRYTFTVIGSPVLHTLVSGKTALELNSSRGEYIKLSNNTIPCLTDFANCSNGFTFHIQVKFLQTDEIKKMYIVGNGGNEPGTDTFFLYYQNHKLYFGNTVEHLKWSSEIQFEIKTNIFQTFELSWSYQHGLKLFLNGDLLKSSNVTSQVNTSSTLTNTISIGKSSGSMSTFALLISDVHFWSVSRHILTAANVITTTIPSATAGHLSSTRQKEISQSTGHSSTTIYQVTTNKHIASTSTRVTSLKEQTSTLSAEASTVSNFISTQPTKTSTAHIKTENHIFKFLNVTGNTIFTTAFTLTAHGDIHIVNIANNQTAIRLNATNGEYMELKNNTLFCKTSNNCYGFVNSIKLNFQSIDYNIKVYILKGPGIYLYYLNKSLHFAYSIRQELWVSHVNYEVRVNLWHTFELKWSKVTGLSLIVDGSNLQTVGKSVHTTVSTNQTQTFTIGLVTTSTSTTFLISGFEILRELYTVEASPITSSSATTFPSKFTESTTKSSHTVFTTIKKTTEQTPKLSSFQQTTVHTSTNALNKSTTKDQATFSNSKTTLLPESSTYSFLYTSRREASPTGLTAVSGEVSYPSYESTKVDASSIASYKTTPVGHTTRPNMQTTTDSKATTTSSNTFYSSSLASSAFPETTYMNSITTQKPYNLGFLNITDQKILTHSYTFTAHGNISLSTAITGQHVVQINTSKHEYIELKNQSIPCIDNKHACTGGFSFQMNINFINIDYSKPTYIIQTTGNSHTGSGIFLYILNSTLYLGYTYHNLTWTTNVKYELKTESWYTFKLTWSMGNGLGLYINGKLVTITHKPKTVSVAGIPTSLTIGMNQINVMTIFQTYGIMIWPYYHETVYPSTITTSSHKSTTNDKHSTQTDSKITTTTRMQASSTTEIVKSSQVPNVTITHTFLSLSTVPSSSTRGPVITTVATPVSPEPGLTTISTTVKEISPIASNTDSTSSTVEPTSVNFHTSTITRHNTEHSIMTNKPISFESHNLSFINITGNLIYTASFIISTHGIVTLEKTSSNETAVRLNGTTRGFIELKTPNISCIDHHESCKNGFTVKLKVKFLTVNTYKKTYILVSSGSIPGSSGIILYYQNNTLYFTSISENRTWESSIHFEIIQNAWHTYELSWSLSYGLGLYIDGTLVKSTNVSTISSTDIPSRPGSLIVGTALGANYSASLLVTGLHIWSASREIVYQAHAQSTEPSSPTPAPTTPTTTTTTTKPTTTLPPVPSFTWNFTQTVNLTINGNVPIKDGGLYFTNATQYIDFGNGTLGCLLNPTSCKDGLTVQFTIVFKRVEENTYLLTSGGQLPNGMGLAIIFRFNFFQFVLSTSTQSWYATCHRSELTPNKPHNIMISWQLNLGLEVFINNVLITSNKNPATHVTTSVSITNVYFGKQTSVVVTGNAVKVDYILQTITFWYAHIHILVERGYCKPPVRPTEKPTTVAPVTTTKPVTTQKQTSSVTTMFTKASTQQCPVGCVSIASTKQPTATPSSKLTTKIPSTPKPTNPTPPPPNTATPSPKPTTERGPPNYTTKPTLEPIVSNDTKAYLVCVFKASTRDIQFIVQLKVDGQVVDQKVNPGQSGVVMFEVSKLNENLYQKKITCSVVAKYVGGTHTTGPFPSTALIPHFTVINKHIIVVEGKSTQFVTVTSTTPPQFYCCKGCRGECQVHIVGSNNFNHRTQQKCNNNYIAQSVIVSSKPPTSNSHICGFALTNQNWDHDNKIEVKATIDNRRDGDHTNTMSIIAHVYNQPANVQISAKPSYSFTITNVQVTAKDNHASSTCKSVNDPHMRTFDGMNYNNMNEGVFVLYRHKSMPFEVRALYHKCNKRSHATCNCGVAVQSGDDVITVTGCHGTNNNHPGQGHGIGLIMQQLFGNKNNELAKTPMTIQIYKNGEFTPGTLIRRFGCGQKYEIELPTGMIVTVQQSYKPFINIYIRGASTDKGESEGLCGNFDGSRSNDLKPSTNAFINAWKSTYENFFFGVAVSSVQFQSTYCSCIKDKNKICLSGIGAFRCVLTNNDITSSLVKQAKRPILTRHKRQAVDPTMDLPATDIPTEEPIDPPDVAEKNCTDHITKSSVTGSCEPVLTSNVTQHIQNCVDDYLATGSYEWAKDALRDIAVECIDNINDLRLANESGNTNITDELPDIPDIEEILNKSCVDDCGNHGSCVQGVCVCDDGYSGVTCDISKATVPTTSIVPFLCDMSSTSDCQGAMVFGENFVDTPSLTCHYQFATVGNVITPSGEKGTVPANFISINQVECPLPRPKTAILTVSNDGTNPSTNASMQVVFNSICHSCSVDDQTFKASCYRQDNNCIIDDTCYANEATRPGDQCQVCRPAANNNQWSQSLETICQEKPQASFVKDDDTKEKTTIALAIVCGVLAAIIVIGAICLIRKKGMSKKSKGEFGSYDFTPTPSVHRQQFTTADNPAYVGTGEKM